ncbi:MAG: OmpA family protein [Pseudomonadota bacterium]
MKTMVFAAAAALALTACQGALQDRRVQGAAGGAVIGAGVGVLAGGDDGRNAAIGAAVGAIAGGAAGEYMRRQEEALKRRTEGSGIEVERQGDQIALTMPSNVTFDVNSAAIKPSFRDPLTGVANTLVEYPSTAVDIIGHASADGDDTYNQTLSEQRAVSVQNYLVGLGMQQVRVNAYGLGETSPIADNATAEGRAANRRVEIILTPVTEG